MPSPDAGFEEVHTDEYEYEAVASARKKYLKENLELKKRNRILNDSLNKLRAEYNKLKAILHESDQEAVGMRSNTREGIKKSVRVVDVNPELGLVVLDAGVRQGLRLNVEYRVVRNEAIIAQLRVVDIRETIAGALVEKMSHQGLPRIGDAAILGGR